MAQSSFLGLPLEIRHKIYKLLLPPKRRELIIGVSTIKSTSFGPLVRTCKQTKIETDEWFNIGETSYWIKYPLLGPLDTENPKFKFYGHPSPPAGSDCCPQCNYNGTDPGPITPIELEKRCSRFNNPWCWSQISTILPAIEHAEFYFPVEEGEIDVNWACGLWMLFQLCRSLHHVDIIVGENMPQEKRDLRRRLVPGRDVMQDLSAKFRTARLFHERANGVFVKPSIKVWNGCSDLGELGFLASDSRIVAKIT
jgi:hypothetical protein